MVLAELYDTNGYLHLARSFLLGSNEWTYATDSPAEREQVGGKGRDGHDPLERHARHPEAPHEAADVPARHLLVVLGGGRDAALLEHHQKEDDHAHREHDRLDAQRVEVLGHEVRNLGLFLARETG